MKQICFFNEYVIKNYKISQIRKGVIFGVGQIPDDGTIWLETVSRHYLRLSLLDGCFSILSGKLNKINPEPWIVVRRKWKNVNFPSGNNHRPLWTVQCVPWESCTLPLSRLGNCNASAERTVLHVMSAAWAVEKTLELLSACHILLHVLQAVGAELLQYPARNECCLQLQSSSRWLQRAVLQSPCVLQHPGCSWHSARACHWPRALTHLTQRLRKMRKLIQQYFSISLFSLSSRIRFF